MDRAKRDVGWFVCAVLVVAVSGCPDRRERGDLDVVVTSGVSRSAEAQQCPKRTWSNAEVLSAMSFGPTPASQLWCGNLLKIPQSGKTRPQADELNCEGSCCGGAKMNDGKNVRAVERAEVRGWITQPTQPDLIEGEMHFMLIPDFGWTTTSPGVRPINHVGAYMAVTTPMGDTFAGGIKVELNGWEPGRICGVERGWCGAECSDGKIETAMRVYRQRGQFCPEFRTRRPADWCYPTTAEHVFSTFDLHDPPHHSATPAGPFQGGDYVRMVGTLWEDDAHGGDCWKGPGTHSANRGWLEMHSVDFMARLPPPAGRSRPHTATKGEMMQLALLGVCIPSSASGGIERQSVDVFPFQPKPAEHWRPKLAEYLSDAFTNRGTAVTAVNRQADRVSVTATVTAPPSFAGRGLFFAGYTAIWERCAASCAGKCGGVYDDCDGMCTASCGTGRECQSGRCVVVQRPCPDDRERCRGRCCSADEICSIRGCEPSRPNRRGID